MYNKQKEQAKIQQLGAQQIEILKQRMKPQPPVTVTKQETLRTTPNEKCNKL